MAKETKKAAPKAANPAPEAAQGTSGEQQEQDPKGEGSKRAIVVSQFRDKDNFERLYLVGEDISHLDAKRIAKLVELNLVELR